MAFGKVATVLAATAIAAFMGSASAAKEVTLKVVTGTPKNLIWNRPLWNFIDRVNERGKGIVQLKYIGGPEVTPVPEQFRAVSTGIIDLHYGPNQYLQGQIPESQAFNASNRSAKDLRAAGALAEIDSIYNAKGNMRFLGYFGSGYQFLIYLKDKPKRTASGGVDLSGLKLRGTGTYKDFFDSLGAVTRTVQVAEVYTSLKRGNVDGIGWVTLAVTALSLDEFLKYRIYPTYWQGDLGMTINLDRWKSLSGEARKIIEEEAIRAEAAAHAFFVEEAKKETAKLVKAGMKDIVLEGAAAKAYLDSAYGSRWAEIAAKVGDDTAGKLRGLFLK
ncbi:MAG: C4-dicarboxylate ABC transporter substrate-binding protein [Rhodospirillaceae bacterium]|nr:C4-dicarboxylate ABC transporter substrate-binding protein [Rhodospirillaceae bacterium]